MRTLRITFVVAALLAFLPAEGGAARARPGLRCGSAATSVHAFYVEVEWTKKTYRTSEKAAVTVTVTRPADQDPLGFGVPIPRDVISTPQEGVTVTTAILTDAWPPPFGQGLTNADGQVTFKIPLKDVEPGPQPVSHYAEKWTNQSGCPDIQEWGYLRQEPAFTVLP